MLPCAVVLLGAGALYLATDGFRALTEESARRLHAAETRPKIAGYRLQDMNGQSLRLGSDSGDQHDATLVGFIYTSCPTICRTAGDDFARLRKKLEEAKLLEKVRLLSVSFDPARDDPEQMREYASQHGADGVSWTVARPRGDMVETLVGSFGVRVIPDGWGGYQHNAAVHLVDREGRLTGIFDTNDFDGILDVLRGPSS